MSLQQSKILLEKINTLHKSVEIDGKVSSIERDLMLSYVRQFYESFLAIGANESISAPAPKPAPVPQERPVVIEMSPAPRVVEPVVAPALKVEEPKPIVVEVPKVEAKPEPIVQIVEKPEPVIPPLPKEEPKPIVVETPKVEIKPEPIAAPPPTPTISHVFPEPPKPRAAQKPLIKPANERVEQSELFEEKMRKELSDKLGETPLDDIKKGMGFNEKIIFINELFDGSAQSFDAAVNGLNNAGSFDTARSILSELSAQNDWASKEKQAKPFIRLVRRRYS
jgi:hypothetical protein